MPIVKTYSATEPERVMVAYDGPVTHVWLRKNIEMDTADNGPDSEPTDIWCADEVAFTVSGTVSAASVEESFDELWSTHAVGELSVWELQAMVGDLTEAVLSMIGGE